MTMFHLFHISYFCCLVVFFFNNTNTSVLYNEMNVSFTEAKIPICFSSFRLFQERMGISVICTENQGIVRVFCCLVLVGFFLFVCELNTKNRVQQKLL